MVLCTVLTCTSMQGTEACVMGTLCSIIDLSQESHRAEESPQYRVSDLDHTIRLPFVRRRLFVGDPLQAPALRDRALSNGSHHLLQGRLIVGVDVDLRMSQSRQVINDEVHHILVTVAAFAWNL